MKSINTHTREALNSIKQTQNGRVHTIRNITNHINCDGVKNKINPKKGETPINATARFLKEKGINTVDRGVNRNG